MVFRGARLRIGLLAAFLLACLAPVAASAGTGIDCTEFANPAAAQYLLDRDDSYADSLDPDGDGTACNEDDDAGDPLSEEDYIYAVWDEVDLQVDTVMEFLDILAGAVEDDVAADDADAAFDALNETASAWAAYPDVAPEFAAPAGLDEISNLYDTWVGTIGDLGTTWEQYLGDGIPPAGDSRDEALEAFGTVLNEFSTTSDEVIEMLAAAEEDVVGTTPAGTAITVSPSRS
jgi:hypothetical protein